MGLCASGIDCDGGLTISKVRDGFEDITVGVESPWATDSTGRIPVRVQEDLGVGETPRGDPLVQGLAESWGGRHAWMLLERTPFVIGCTYNPQWARPFRVKST